ncbi:MAG: hypothetical protein KA791_02885 [Flavobacteriales bacterium]|nr:hypothetical protein [Flavobacteriales bacterium]
MIPRQHAAFFHLLCPLLIALNAINPSHAQDQGYRTEMGPVMERKMKELPMDVLGQDADGVVLQRSSPGNSIVLERYGNDLKLAGTGEFEPKRNGQELEAWYPIQFADKYLMVARDKPAKQDSAWFYVSRLSPASLVPEGDWSLLGSLDTKGRKLTFTMEHRGVKDFIVIGTKERATEAQFSSVQSPNGKSILFYTDYAMDKDEPDGYDLLVLDQDLQKRWSARLQLPHLESRFEHWESTVDDAGNAYLQGCLYFKGDEVAVKGKPNFEHRLMRVGSEGIEWDTPVALGDRFIKSCFTYEEEQDLYVAGFFAEDKSLEARGLYVQRIDPGTGTVVERFEIPFDLALFTAFYGADKGASAHGKFMKNPAQGIESLKMRSFARLPDGRLRVVGEVAWKEWIARTSSMPGTRITQNIERKDVNTYPVYHNEEMAVWTLGKNGAVERVDVVKKVQSVPYWELLAGYSRFWTGDGADQYLLFNDDPANLDVERISGERKTAKWNGGKGCVTLVHVKPDGTQERSTLFDIKDDEAALYVALTVQRSDHETWFFSKFKEQERWVRINH